MKHLSEAEDHARENQMMGEEDIMPDVGLFEASHLACPVLPQYHPKQLMELLNSGKIRWVKAILSHLVKCIAPDVRGRLDDRSPREWDKNRSMERSPSPKRSSTSRMPEELTLDFSLDDEQIGRSERRLSIAAEKQGLSYFGPRQARMLSKLLTHTQLPGLTSLDQMHLLAL